MCKHLKLTHLSGLCISFNIQVILSARKWENNATPQETRDKKNRTYSKDHISKKSKCQHRHYRAEWSECNLWVQKLVEWEMAFMTITLYVNKKERLHTNIWGFWSRCSIVVSIPACHAGDPGSIPGSGEAKLLFCLLFVVLFRAYCYGEVTWNLELF